MGSFVIYALHHDDSRRIYVGQSIRGLERARHHGRPYNLKAGRTPATLASWIKKYQARGGYQIAVLEECVAKEDLNEAEKFHIAYLRSLGIPLLNLTDGGDGNPGRHITLTPESRERIRDAMRKFAATPEGRAHMAKMSAAGAISPNAREKRSAAMKGRNTGLVVSEATKQKLRAANLGKKQSPETVAKRAAANIGRRWSEETRKKMSERVTSEETRTKHRVRMLGNKMSPESVAKVAAANRGRKQSPEAVEKRAAKIRGRKQAPEGVAKRAASIRLTCARRNLVKMLRRVVSGSLKRRS